MSALFSRPYLLLILTTLFWGANAVAGKLAVGHVSPLVLTFLRWLFAVAILSLFALPAVRRDWPAIRRSLPLLVALGAVGFTAFNATMFVALNHTSAINVTIVQAGMPLLIFLANFLLFRTRATPWQIVGFSITLAGVAVTVSHGEWRTLSTLALNFGDALMLLAILLYAGYTVALRFKPQIHWQSLIFVLAVSALAASIPFALYEIGSGGALAPDLQGLALALYIALFPSIVGQVFFIRGNELIGPNRAGLFINLVPIFGTGLAVLFAGERLYLYHLAGLILVLGGIWLAEKGKPLAESAAGAE